MDRRNSILIKGTSFDSKNFISKRKLEQNFVLSPNSKGDLAFADRFRAIISAGNGQVVIALFTHF